ncbi:hypothetical protein GGR56DRAFT_686248 [Xylariaceae sp. FL0804]|nr:hypothetical protein GGR56DRAFT_686248 [Xylariaceae sp. FL0804]
MASSTSESDPPAAAAAAVFPAATRLTFGVEFEFLVATLDEEGTTDPHAHVAGLAPVLRVPRSAYNAAADPDVAAVHPAAARERYVHARVADVVSRHLGGRRVRTNEEQEQGDDDWQVVEGSASGSGSSSGFAGPILEPWQHWAVEGDSSVRATDGDDDDAQYDWVGVELKSPVRYACEPAFQEITRAALAHGPARARGRRRVAGLVWAAAPLLYAVHGPLRRANDLCRSIRARSGLARGTEHLTRPEHDAARAAASTTTGLCHRYLGQGRRFGEDPISTREQHRGEAHVEAFERTRRPHHYEPFRLTADGSPEPSSAVPGSHYRDVEVSIDARAEAAAAAAGTTNAAAEPPRPTLPRLVPRAPPTVDTPEELRKLSRRLEWCFADLNGHTPGVHVAAQDVGVFEGVRRIFAAPSSCELERLLYTNGLASVNFLSYSCSQLTGERQRRTIEFRAADGTLSDWAETWARVCVGLVRFAIQAPPASYARVLEGCDLADRGLGAYDVADLVADLGLFAEAWKVQQRIAQIRKAEAARSR